MLLHKQKQNDENPGPGKYPPVPVPLFIFCFFFLPLVNCIHHIMSYAAGGKVYKNEKLAEEDVLDTHKKRH